jgi:uncharacterized protein (DUF302 family)
MTSVRFAVERIDMTTGRGFDETTTLFEKIVPAADASMLTHLVETKASAGEVRAAVSRMQGELEFIAFAKVTQGALTSALGTPKRLTTYLIGNPVIANRMFERDRATGLYAPLRVSLFEDPEGTVHFVYDRPSSVFASFEDTDIASVGALLDEKLLALSQRLQAGAS